MINNINRGNRNYQNFGPQSENDINIEISYDNFENFRKFQKATIWN